MGKRSRYLLIVPIVTSVVLLTCLGGPVLLWVLGGGTPHVTVDYAEKLNAPAEAVPEGERAWPVYLEAIAALPSHERDGDVALDIQGQQENGDDPAVVSPVVARYSDEIAVLRRAAMMPELGLVVSPVSLHDLNVALGRTSGPAGVGPASGALMDHTGLMIEFYGVFRRLARVLATDARAAAHLGDGPRFVDDIDALLGLAGHVGSQKLLLNQLVEAAVRALAFGRALEVLSEKPGLLTEQELVHLSAVLDNLDDGGEFEYSNEIEQWFFYDMVQRMYTDDGMGGGHIAPPAPAPSGGDRMVAGLAALLSPNRAEVVYRYERQIEAELAWLGQPAWLRGDPPDEVDPFESSMARWAATVFGLGIPENPMYSIALTAGGAVSLNQKEDGLRTAIALERYRLAVGTWPETLDRLVPGYLSRVPIDRFDGRPMRYTLTEDGPLLYSVGTDREDDGGRHTRRASRWVPRSEIAERLREDENQNGGDWVIFPVPEDD